MKVKMGIRKPSVKGRIKARTSVKRALRHRAKLKVPRGYGWFTNPKKAAYNRLYRRTTIDPVSTGKRLVTGKPTGAKKPRRFQWIIIAAVLIGVCLCLALYGNASGSCL